MKNALTQAPPIQSIDDILTNAQGEPPGAAKFLTLLSRAKKAKADGDKPAWKEAVSLALIEAEKSKVVQQEKVLQAKLANEKKLREAHEKNTGLQKQLDNREYLNSIRKLIENGNEAQAAMMLHTVPDIDAQVLESFKKLFYQQALIKREQGDPEASRRLAYAFGLSGGEKVDEKTAQTVYFETFIKGPDNQPHGLSPGAQTTPQSSQQAPFAPLEMPQGFGDPTSGRVPSPFLPAGTEGLPDPTALGNVDKYLAQPQPQIPQPPLTQGTTPQAGTQSSPMTANTPGWSDKDHEDYMKFAHGKYPLPEAADKTTGSEWDRKHQAIIQQFGEGSQEHQDFLTGKDKPTTESEWDKRRESIIEVFGAESKEYKDFLLERGESSRSGTTVGQKAQEIYDAHIEATTTDELPEGDVEGAEKLKRDYIAKQAGKTAGSSLERAMTTVESIDDPEIREATRGIAAKGITSRKVEGMLRAVAANMKDGKRDAALNNLGDVWDSIDITKEAQIRYLGARTFAQMRGKLESLAGMGVTTGRFLHKFTESMRKSDFDAAISAVGFEMVTGELTDVQMRAVVEAETYIRTAFVKFLKAISGTAASDTEVIRVNMLFPGLFQDEVVNAGIIDGQINFYMDSQEFYYTSESNEKLAREVLASQGWYDFMPDPRAENLGVESADMLFPETPNPEVEEVQ